MTARLRQRLLSNSAIVTSLTWILVYASPGDARTWEVFVDGSGDAPTVEAAVDSTSPGDTVLVGPGTHAASFNVGPAHDPISIIGMNGAEATVLDAQGERHCIESGIQQLLLQDLTFIGAQGGYQMPPYLLRGWFATIRRCRFMEAFASVVLDGTSVVEDCEFVESGLESGAGQITVTTSRFEGANATAMPNLSGAPQSLTMRECVFSPYSILPAVMVYYIDPLPVTVHLEENVYVGGANPFVNIAPTGPTDRGAQSPLGFGIPVSLTVVRNTISQIDGTGLVLWPNLTSMVVEGNLVTACNVGMSGPSERGGAAISCNNVWGNDVNWEGVPDLTGTDGNISVFPKFCDPLAGDFRLASNSPCLPSNNDCGVQIGAFGEGCGPLSIESTSWGRLKSLYR